MKIKDIRQFRTLYKNEIREIDSSNRNEHFVGVRTEYEGKSQYGFFEIYHGDKEGFNESDGIRGFLEGFLDMAKDGQAVYEFLQNAVDANSSKFCLFWGKDPVDGNTYLLVINNGKMFDFDSVRSILNVGVSTKSSNNFTIGKFGIGFKLAHRLVGRENGLDELIHQNYGPVLFSWKKNEITQLENLIKDPIIIPVKQLYEVISKGGKRKAIVKTDDPWLFKILITNFPCQPENETSQEIIFDNQYNEISNAFSKIELQALGRWIKTQSAYLGDDYKEGSLFFIRLGQGKQSHLEEENLEEGVKFSLAILNKIAKQSLNHDGLKTVNLRGKELEPVDLIFESFLINKTKQKDQFRYLRFGKTENLSDIELSKEEADNDIEILLGFTGYKKAEEAFHNAPNFYLFFPLSEEKHKLRFILHSNAFYKSASRTFLQKGSVGEEGINERIFTVFINKLKERMLSWAYDSDTFKKEKFIELYANLLLSDPSDNPERLWINEPLYNPILEFIKAYIPVKDIVNETFKLVQTSDSVYIKNTALPIDKEKWLPSSFNWFFWDKEQDYSIYNEASSANKLNLKPFSIIHLLEVKNIYQKINTWLDDENIELILKELNELIFTNENEIKPSDDFKENVSNLRLWKFEDNKYLTISEIDDLSTHESYLLLFGKIDELAPYLKQAEFVLSTISFSRFPLFFKFIQTNARLIKYLNDYTYLTQLFNKKFTASNFSSSDKFKILKLIEKLGDDRSTQDRIDRMKQLALFSNEQNKIVPFKQLLKNTSHTWLHPFVIKQSEYSDVLKEYLVNDEYNTYSDIILPFWDEIVTNNKLTSNDITSMFETVQLLYSKIQNATTLSDKKIIKINSIFYLDNYPHYYSKTLLDFNEGEYENLKSLAVKLDLNPLPDIDLLKFYNNPPFKIYEETLHYEFPSSDIIISLEEAKAFLKLYLKEDIELYKKIILHQNIDNEIIISKKTENIYPVLSDNQKVNDYIAKYHSTTLLIFPDLLSSEFGENIVLQSDKLINRLTHDCNVEDDVQLSELIELVITSTQDAKNKLADKVKNIIFDLGTEFSHENVSIRFIQLLLNLNDNDKAAEILKNTVTVISGSESIKLSDTALLGQNEIIFTEGEKKFILLLSSILPNPNSNATKLIGQLTEKLVSIINADKHLLDTIFGLSSSTDKEFIYKSLQEEYNNLPLDNAHQLAFLLHFSKSDFGKLDGFQIAKAQDIADLKNLQIYYTDEEMPFIHPSHRLNSRYIGLKELIANEKPYFNASDNTTIYFSPYFEKNKFILPKIDFITEPFQNLSLINLIFNNWALEKDRYNFIELEDEKRWKNLIGFEPKLTIVGSDLVLESEILPDFINIWIEKDNNNKNDKYSFLRSLGVSLKGSDIVTIRKFLKGEILIKPDVSYYPPETLIINTFIYLSNLNLDFVIESQHSDLLKELYNRILVNTDLKDIPLPIINSQKNKTFTLSIAKEAVYIDNHFINKLEVIFYELNQLPDHISKTIIYAPLFGTTNILDKFYIPLEIDFDELDTNTISLNKMEWNRDFYNQWKAVYPNYRIFYYPGNIPYRLKYDSKFFFNYNKNEITFINNEIIVNNDKNDKSIIALIEQKNYLPLDALSLLKELFNKYDDSIQDFLLRIQSNQKLREEFEKLKQKELLEQKRKN